MILEGPVQKSPIPRKVIDYADKYRIKVRDMTNKFYN